MEVSRRYIDIIRCIIYYYWVVIKIRFRRLTQIFDQPEHDPSDVQITLNPQRPFHLQIGHVDLQVPRTVADDEPVAGGHVVFSLAVWRRELKILKLIKKYKRNEYSKRGTDRAVTGQAWGGVRGGAVKFGRAVVNGGRWAAWSVTIVSVVYGRKKKKNPESRVFFISFIMRW